MPQWTVDAPTRLAFDDVTALRVRAIAGSVAILATSEAPALDITRISGQPLTGTIQFKDGTAPLATLPVNASGSTSHDSSSVEI